MSYALSSVDVLARKPGGVNGVHRLKTLPAFYAKIVTGEKTFEIRQHDRPYAVGDLLVLEEWSPDSGYTWREEHRFVTYITDYAQQPGYVVMGLKNLDELPMLAERIDAEVKP